MRRCSRSQEERQNLKLVSHNVAVSSREAEDTGHRLEVSGIEEAVVADMPAAEPAKGS